MVRRILIRNEQKLSFEKQVKPELEQTQYKDKQAKQDLRRKVRVRKKRILEKAKRR